MEGIKGEKNEQQSDGAENNDQHGFHLGRFEVEDVRFFVLKCFVSVCRIVLPRCAGSTFSENS